MFQVERTYTPFFALKVIACVCLISNPAIADQPRLFTGVPDSQELAEFLFSTKEKSTSRSWSVADEPAPANVAALQIQFEFDSVEIKPKSVVIIERLAQALMSPDAGVEPVLIEGHTDAIGDESYNLDLSKRRAQSIREYLVNIYKIETERLYIDGLGESELLTPELPKAAVNRRVQIKRFNPTSKLAGRIND